MKPEPLLHVTHLRAYLSSRHGVVKAVDDVSFEVGHGEAMGLVGESGSGKSVMSRAIMGLMPRRSDRTGSVLFKGRELIGLPRKEMSEIWGPQISMVFQDPGRSLNPVVPVERQLTEGMRRHLGLGRSEARGRALQLLREVGVSDPERRLRNYPHEMSGGMCQRVMIAAALACEPDLLIADEPTTALDVTIQRQILDLLRRVQRERNMSMILISHNLPLVAGRTDRTAVMYAGRLAETGSTRQVFESPRHRYTAALLAATPTITHERHSPFRLIPGTLPNPVKPPAGCRFAARCDHFHGPCHELGPDMTPVAAGHHVACADPVPAPAAVGARGGEHDGR
ncbi:ABC transporter ATP-binding protein [Streptomyces mangrovisoli]|uniref:Dipeptide/oligopeptide/nickel ABC transporter ATP-binding protein n=1 Tax=Streptomyces mangrovisoli TaxID=1428628 RepID=A0A1J4NW00_9ACTN|nr:ABC transporter ATP-binding protein [Streptomyces mangrovisoli]OIJ65405.1 dipeptide/oligopeptide/nickel ABC transporter ATP-binding protein [Streptomyces mangrovisoli]